MGRGDCRRKRILSSEWGVGSREGGVELAIYNAMEILVADCEA